MQKRVVVTGLGVITSNAHGADAFAAALQEGKSGIRHFPEMAELNFACQVGGRPQNSEAIAEQYFGKSDRIAMNEVMVYAGIAAIDAWKDAGFDIPEFNSKEVFWDTGAIIGVGIGGMDTTINRVYPMISQGKVRRLGSATVEQVMSSCASAKIAGLLALGNQVTTNSSACNTGTEAIVEAFYRIRSGFAEKMLAGGAEGSSPYIWGGFDAMKVINRNSNAEPEKASRPMSASAGGFIPGSGAGIVVLESLEHAQKRGARIYAEILGGYVNCGGHRLGGSMTAPNPMSVQRCIRAAVEMAGIAPDEIDYINGHLTATFVDPHEIANWAAALELTPEKFPRVNSTKSMIGHCLGAAGGIETVATILQLTRGFLHKSLNCEDLHEAIKPYAKSVLMQGETREIRMAAKASFGFGDVNGCLVLSRVLE
jgi:3-oxoacyl-(acyl-carrier-protein) synthase